MKVKDFIVNANGDAKSEPSCSRTPDWPQNPILIAKVIKFVTSLVQPLLCVVIGWLSCHSAPPLSDAQATTPVCHVMQ